MLEGARIEFRRGDNDPDQESWPPELVGYLWDWFNDLTDWRSGTGFGVGPLSHLEIECWARLMGVNPKISPFEVDTLRKLDRECRIFWAEKDAPPKQSIGESLKAYSEARKASGLVPQAKVKGKKS